MTTWNDAIHVLSSDLARDREAWLVQCGVTSETASFYILEQLGTLGEVDTRQKGEDYLVTYRPPPIRLRLATPREHFEVCGPFCEHVLLCPDCAFTGLCERHSGQPGDSFTWSAGNPPLSVRITNLGPEDL
jgi:hypothetical protein